MPLLDEQLGGSLAQQTKAKDPEDHASHAAAPVAFHGMADAKTLTLALAGFMALIYGVHVLGRVVKA